jgi:hypothetical protein
MASLPVRDPVGDHLLTPQNSALVVIDYQPSHFAGVRSIDLEVVLRQSAFSVGSDVTAAEDTDRLGDSVDDHADESGWLPGSLEKVAYQSQQLPVASKSSPPAHTRQPTPSRGNY